MNQDTLTEAALASLLEHLKDAGRVFVLIDPLLADPWADFLSTSARDEQRAHTPTYPLYLRIEDPQRRTYLAELSDATLQDERVLNATVRIAVQEHLGLHDTADAQVRSVCGWLLCQPKPESVDAQQQVQHLQHGLAQHTWVLPPPEQGNTHVLFRFFDPRISAQLSQILGTKWGDALAAVGVHQWLSLNELGMMTCIGQASQTPGSALWHIDAGEWHALTQLSLCNLIKRLLPQWELPSRPTNQALAHALARAHRWGLRSEIDTLRFVHCALTLHPKFDEHAPFAYELKNLLEQGNPEGSFAHVAHDLIVAWQPPSTGSL